MKRPFPGLLRKACSLSLALVSLGCGNDEAKGNLDAGPSKKPRDESDASLGQGDGDQGDGDQGDGDQGDGDRGDGDNSSDAGGSNASCTNDDHEPDGTADQAEAKQPISGIVPVEITGRTACAQDTDLFWAGPVDNGGKAAAELSYDVNDGPLELTLLDADGEPITNLDVAIYKDGYREVGINEFYGADMADSSDNYFYVRVHNPNKRNVKYSVKVTAQVFGP